MIAEQIIEAMVSYINEHRNRIIEDVCSQDVSEPGIIAADTIDYVVEVIRQLKPQNQSIDVLDSWRRLNGGR